MRASWLVVFLLGCGPGPGADAGLDAGLDAGPDLRFTIVGARDAGPIQPGTAWPAVSAVLSTPPSGLGMTARWVQVFPTTVDRAWAGGVLLFDGGVVAIPYDESSVLVIHPTDDTSVRWPLTGGAVQEGWLGGVLLPDGIVIAIPRNASKFLRIDPAAGTAVPFGDDLSDTGVDGGQDKFRGGVLGLNGKVYAAPSTAHYVARLDPATGTVTRLPVPPPAVEGLTYGAVLFPTGDIVMFPNADTPGLLVIPSRDGGQDDVWLLPRPPLPALVAFTGAGVLTGADTALAPPQQNASPLRYEAGLFSWVTPVAGVPAQISNAWYLGAWSTDGHCYFPPYGTDQALRFDREGHSERLDVPTSVFRSVFGAVGLPDGRIIGIPHSRSAWLELSPGGRVSVPAEAMTSPFLNKL